MSGPEEKQLTEPQQRTVDEADEIRRDLLELRNQKKEQLKNNTTQTSQNSSTYADGVIESVHRDTDGNAILTVEYYVDGTNHTTSFTLPLPTTPEDYTIQNKYVRLRKTVDATDEEVLIGRTVPLTIASDGTASLDLPTTPSRLGQTTHSIKRTVKNTAAYTHLTAASGLARGTAHALVGTTLLTAALLLGLNAIADVGIRFLVDVVIATVLFGIAVGTVAAAEDDIRNSLSISKTVLSLTGLLITYATITGTLPTVWLSDEATLYQNVATVVQHALMTSMIVIGLGELTNASSVKTHLKEKVSSVRTRIQQWRGVEYVNDYDT